MISVLNVILMEGPLEGIYIECFSSSVIFTTIFLPFFIKKQAEGGHWERFSSLRSLFYERATIATERKNYK